MPKVKKQNNPYAKIQINKLAENPKTGGYPSYELGIKHGEENEKHYAEFREQCIPLAFQPKDKLPARFIIPFIVKHLAPWSSETPYNCRILSGSGKQKDANVIVNIPPSVPTGLPKGAGGFTFELTAEGLVKFGRLPLNLELEFETGGSVVTTEDLECRDFSLSAWQLTNTYRMSATDFSVTVNEIQNKEGAKLDGKNLIALSAETIRNEGSFSAKTLALTALEENGVIYNLSTGHMTSKKTLTWFSQKSYNAGQITGEDTCLIEAVYFENLPTGHINSHIFRVEQTERCINRGNIKSNQLILNATTVKNFGAMCATGRTEIQATTFSHTQGSIEGNTIYIRARDIHITAPIKATGDIEIFHEGGEWGLDPNALQTKGKVIIHWQEARPIQQLNILGSLCYVLAKTAKEPLMFLCDQPVIESLEVITPTPVILGSEARCITFGGNSENRCQSISIKSPSIDLAHARIGTIKGSTLIGHILKLGNLQGSSYNRTVLSGGRIYLEASGVHPIIWHQIILDGDELIVNGKSIDDISSLVVIKGNAWFNVEESQHRLLTESRDLAGKPAAYHHESAVLAYQELHKYQEAVTWPSYIYIGETLTTSGQTKLIGSELYCQRHCGPPVVMETFTPSQAWTRYAIFRNQQNNIVSSQHNGLQYQTGITEGKPFRAVFDDGTGLKREREAELSDISFAQALALRGLRHGASSPQIFLMDHNRNGKVASLFFRLSPLQGRGGYSLEVWVSHRTLGKTSLCLSSSVLSKESKESAENRTLLLSSLKGFELLQPKVQDSLTRASVQVSADGVLCVAALPPDRFSYAFETSGPLLLNNVRSQGGEIGILRASRVKVIGDLEAGLGLLVQSSVLDTRDAHVHVPHGKCLLRGLAEGQSVAWLNDQGHFSIDGAFEIDAAQISNKRGRIQLGSQTNKEAARSRFQVKGIFDNTEGASFVSEQDFQAVIQELRVTKNSFFYVEGNANLIVQNRVLCRDASSVSASHTLNIPCKKIYADETSLVKSNWTPLKRKLGFTTAKTRIQAETAVIESPVVAYQASVETVQHCDLPRGAYAEHILTLLANGSLFYGKADAGLQFNVIRPNRDCQLQHPLKTQASVYLEGLTTGATKAPLTAKRQIIFNATSQDPGIRYPIQLSQPVSAGGDITYRGTGVEQTTNHVHAESSIHFGVDNLKVHQEAGHSAKRIETQALASFDHHEDAFNATELFTVRMREGCVLINKPIVNSGGMNLELVPTATQPLSVQASMRTGAYLLYLYPYNPITDRRAPSLKAMEEIRQTLEEGYSQRTPTLIRRGTSLFVYGLNAEGETQFRELPYSAATHPLFSKIDFPPESPIGFRGEPRMMVELYRILKQEKAHFAQSMPLTIHAPSVPVIIGDKDKEKPTDIHALHGKANITSLDLSAEHLSLYGRDGFDLESQQSCLIGHRIPIAANKPYSELHSEGPGRVHAEQGSINVYSTLLETRTGCNPGDLRVSSSQASCFEGSQLRIDRDAYLPNDTRIEIGTASQQSKYKVWKHIEQRKDSKKFGFVKHHKTTIVSKLEETDCTEQWPTTDKSDFLCGGTAHFKGTVNVLGSNFQAKDKESSAHITVNDFTEKRVVELRDGSSELQDIQNFPGKVALINSFQVSRDFGTGSAWSSVAIIRADVFRYGPNNNTRISITNPHEAEWDLARNIRFSASQVWDSPYSTTMQSSLLPIVYSKYEEAPVIIKHPNGSFERNTENLVKRFNAQTEFELINKEIWRQLGQPFLPDCRTEKENYEKIVRDTEQYFHQLFGDGNVESSALQLHASRLTFEHPILVYKQVEITNDIGLKAPALIPSILNPYKPKHVALYYNALRANYVIMDVNKVIITSNLIADKGMKITTNTFEAQRLQYEENRSIVEIEINQKLLKKKTRVKISRVTTLSSQVGSGNIATLDGPMVLNIGNLHSQGATFSGSQGITGEIDNLVIKPNLDLYHEYHQSKARNFLQSRSNSEYLARFHVVESVFESSEGMIDLHCTDSARLVACRFQSGKGIKLHAEGALLLEDVVTRHQLGTMTSSKKLMLTVTRGSKEEHVPVVFYSGGKVEISSSTSIHGIAPQSFGKKGIRYTAPKVRIDARILNRYIQSKTSGIDGLSLKKQKTNMQQQSASQIVSISSEGNVEYHASKYDLILEAPFIKAARELLLKAKQNVRVEDVATQSSIDTRTYSAGLQFFGSDAIQALMQKDFKAAAQKLLQSFPVLGDLKTLVESRDLADASANAFKSIFNTYQFMKNMGQSGDFWKDLGKGLTEMIGDVGVRFGSGDSFESSTLTLVPWLMARNIIVKAEEGSIEMVGVQAKAEESITGQAAQKLDIKASSEVKHRRVQEKGVTPSINIFTGVPGISADLQQQKEKNIHFKASELNAPKVSFMSGTEINLAGVCVEAQHAFLESQIIRIQSLQDESTSSQKGGGFSLSEKSIGGSISHASSHSKSTQAETQINARETLHIRAHQSTHLTGVKIGVGNQGKALQVKLPSGESQDLYEYPMPEDGDSLFHALGIPRAIAAKQLLEARDNGEVRELLAREIMHVILNSDPIPVCLQTPEFLEILEFYGKTVNEIRRNAPGSEAAKEQLEQYVRTPEVLRAYMWDILPNPPP